MTTSGPVPIISDQNREHQHQHGHEEEKIPLQEGSADQTDGLTNSQQLRVNAYGTGKRSGYERIPGRQTKASERRQTALNIINGQPEKSRDALYSYVAGTVDRNDALMTLPITLVYIFVFIFLVWQHLRINDRRHLSESVEDWTNGRDPYTDLRSNADDMDSYWEWLLEIAIPNLLDQKSKNDHTNFTQSVIANRNVFIGDLQLTKEANGELESKWLLNSEIGQKILENSPQDWSRAAKEAALDLQHNQGWTHSDITLLQLSFVTYAETSQMFGWTKVKVFLDNTGFVRPVIDTTVVVVRLYPHWPVIIADIFFLMILALLFYQEMTDIVSHLRLGFHEFLDYWKFWNCVDWICIILGLLTTFLWLFIIFAVQADILEELIDVEGDFRLKVDVMALDDAKIEELQDTLNSLGWVLFWMHLVMSMNTFTIVMKFFKAFQANPRLEVVRATLTRAAPDLCHFFIIFTTIFLPFAMIGHILFGNDIAEFSSLMSSVNAGITALFGEFSWYVDDVGPLRFTRRLPSGIPCMFVFIWYALYMFMVLLVLLNMLLAVILKHYNRIADQLGEDSLAIWAQLRLFWKFQKETSRFMSLESILVQMENDAAPAHPQEVVTMQSLMDAFHMDKDQAVWIMKNLQDALDKELKLMMEDAEARRFQHLLAMVEKTGEDVANLNQTMQDTKDVLEHGKSKAPRVRGPAKAGPDARIDRLQKNVAKIMKLLEEHASSLGPGPAMAPRLPKVRTNNVALTGSMNRKPSNARKMRAKE